MQILAGTSGYSYKEWKGNFYPEKIAAAAMLSFYATRLPTVEINNTFYRMPRANVLDTWKEQVPGSFRFSIKASRRITHLKRLKDVASETEYLLGNASRLEDRLGTYLFQMPPYLKKDAELLRTFLESLPKGTPAAFEFRRAEWFDDEIYHLLRGGDHPLVHVDEEEGELRPIVGTASWGYLRLRRAGYDDDELKQLVEMVREQTWDRAYVYFKHEDAGLGAQFALRFLELAASA
jgi:uncharacterized protein YecE (DUF72 family)